MAKGSGVFRPADWEYLIAHHFPNRYDRTLTLRVRTQSYHFCARCTGELVGFVTVITGFLTFPPFGALFSNPLADIILGLCPSAALADWLTQTVGSRESTNALRLVSGGLLGIAVGGLVAFLLTQQWMLFGLGVAVLGSYLTTGMVVLYRTGAWRRVIAEHFP